PLLISAYVTIVLPHAWQGTVICLFLWGLAMVWLRSFKIILSRETLVYNRLFRRPFSVDISNIAALRFESGIQTYSDRWKPYYRLLIDTRDGRRMAINAKVFGLRRMA